MFRLIPVVETGYDGERFNWVPDADHRWVELTSATGAGVIARVVAMLAVYNRIADADTIEEVAAALEGAERLILPGGLIASDGGVAILPSCCCGLESWRDWAEVAPGAASPWLGHDPEPWVECGPDRAIVWEDIGDTPNLRSVSASYPEIAAALRAAQADLAGFTERLSEWLSSHAPANRGLADRFAEQFHVLGGSHPS
jgi:hypothetical protein